METITQRHLYEATSRSPGTPPRHDSINIYVYLYDFSGFFFFIALTSRRYGYKSSTDRSGVLIFLHFALWLLDIVIIIPQHNDHL